jgi:hypothetical protein
MLTVKEGSAATDLLAFVADHHPPPGKAELPAGGVSSGRDAVS